MSVHQKPDGRWYVHWRDDTGRHTKTFGRGPEERDKACAYDARLTGSLRVLLDDFEEMKKVEGVGEAYLKEMRRVGLKVGTDVIKPPNRITYADVARSIGSIPGISKITTNRYMSYMKVLFNFARRRGYIMVNPLAEWQKRGEQPRRLQLTLEDLNKVYKVSAPHLQWIIKCGVNLGMRPGPSELFSLRWSDVNWSEKSVTIRSAKTGRERVVYISDQFVEDLKRMHQIATTPFVCEYQGRPIRKVRNAWQSALRRAKVGHTAVLYELRHLYATTLLRGGIDVRAVSELLGHQSAKMTLDTYAHCLPGVKRAAAGVVPRVGDLTSEGP